MIFLLGCLCGFCFAIILIGILSEGGDKHE